MQTHLLDKTTQKDSRNLGVANKTNYVAQANMLHCVN